MILVVLILASRLEPRRRGMTSTPMMRAMIPSTIMSSRMVKPPSPRPPSSLFSVALRIFFPRSFSSVSSRSFFLVVVPLQHRVHVHDRRQDREHDERHGPAHDDDHDRFEHRREPAELHLDLRLVDAGDVAGHLLELPGALTA